MLNRCAATLGILGKAAAKRKLEKAAAKQKGEQEEAEEEYPEAWDHEDACEAQDEDGWEDDAEAAAESVFVCRLKVQAARI